MLKPTEAFGIAVAVVGMMYARLRPGRCGRGSGVGSVAGAAYASYILLSGAMQQGGRSGDPSPRHPGGQEMFGLDCQKVAALPLISARHADALRGVAKFSGLPLLLVLDVLLLEQRFPAPDERVAGGSTSPDVHLVADCARRAGVDDPCALHDPLPRRVPEPPHRSHPLVHQLCHPAAAAPDSSRAPPATESAFRPETRSMRTTKPMTPPQAPSDYREVVGQ